MVTEQLNKARARILQFLAKHPHVSRLQLATRAKVHRNTIYADPSKWAVATVDKLEATINEIELEEAKAQRKSRPRLAKAA